jgi:pentatricopeptide repeat protein
MLAALLEHGEPKQTIALFRLMLSTNTPVTAGTCIVVLRACTELRELQLGEQIHMWIEQNLGYTTALRNVLMNMYAKCGKLEKVREIFNTLKSNSRFVT